MPYIFHKLYGIPIPQTEYDQSEIIPEPVELPDDHPCVGCCVLDTTTGVPYCFLPNCHKDIFTIPEDTIC